MNKRPPAPQVELRPGRGPGGPMGARMNVQKPKDMQKTIKRLFGYIGKNKYILITLLAIMLAVTVVDLLGPFFQQKAIDTITLDENNLSIDFKKLSFYLIVMAITFACNAVLYLCQGLLSAKLSQATVFTMRADLFEKISRLPISYTDRHKHGDIMSRMTNDVENVSNAVSQSITMLFSSVLTLVGALAFMIYYSWQLTLVAILTIPITITVSAKLGKFMRKYFVRQQKYLGEINGQVEEMVTSYKTVVAYGKEDEVVENFNGVSDKLRKNSISARVWGSVMGPIMNFLGNLQYVLIAAIGGILILNRTKGITIGSIQAMLQYSKKFTHPINQIANQYSAILTALAGAERIFEIMDAENEVDEGKDKIDIDRITGAIEFENITFSYEEGSPVIKNLSLSVKAGQKVALVGATGSGKTTIVNLLTRFYELDSGRITIDGKDITKIPKDDLRHAIAIVLQDTVLFCDDLRTNIRYGNLDASEEAIRRAAETSRASEFIDRLPDGYDTELAESGSNLSQGQRQLLSIARAVLADPKILILDEATSSVDTRTEMNIQQAMLNLMKNRTSLVIAHRLSTIRDADVIVVLRDGEIAESGSHEELLALNGEYAKLYSNQFAGIET